MSDVVPVKLRPEILAQRAYKQGQPAPANSFKLSSNELPFAPLDSVVAAATGATEFNRYPDAAATKLRQALAEHYGLTADQVLVGAGSVSLLYQAVLAAAGAGDEVMYPWRSFEAYPGMVTVAGASSVQVPLDRDSRVDLDAMLDAITDRTRLVIVCSPNNPTGTYTRQDEFERFLERVPSDLLVIADEAYIEFVTDTEALNATRLLADCPNLVIARTLSKAYGLAGLRVGYLLGNPRVLNAFNTTAIPFLVSAQAQAAAAFDGEIAALMPEMQKRKDASAGSTDWPWILICIDDLKRCIDSINDQTLRRLASILVLGKGLRVAVIVSGNAADITKLSASGERFTMEMTGKTTLLLGGSAQAHMFARTDLAYSAASQDAGAGMGYLVQDGHAVKLKAVQK